MKILVFDNYDSFTYNLVHLVEKIIRDKVDVARNDQIPLEAVDKYDKIILSPGPGVPSEAGSLLPLIKQYASSKSILGVCLGHQAIGKLWRLVNLRSISWCGKSSTYYTEEKPVNTKCGSFNGMNDGLWPDDITAG
jgi:anthranilate synthase component 2